MTQQSNKQQSASEAEETAKTPQPPKGGAEEVQQQAAGVKAEYVPKYNVKKGKETKHFQFKEITYREVLFEDMTNAQRVCGKSDGNEFTMAIMAQACEFDGKKVTYEDLQKMRWSDFLEFQGQLMDTDWMGSKEQLSSSLARLGLV